MARHDFQNIAGSQLGKVQFIAESSGFRFEIAQPVVHERPDFGSEALAKRISTAQTRNRSLPCVLSVE